MLKRTLTTAGFPETKRRVMDTADDTTAAATPIAVEKKKRKRPSYMLPSGGDTPVMRVFPLELIKLVDDIWGAREVLRDDEPDELLELFLEQEVNYLAEVMETPFFNDNDQAAIYSKLREGACAIELAIFELMKVGFQLV